MTVGKAKLYSLLNYFSQLRMYSYLDIILMMVAFKADTIIIVSCSFMWFGFLIHLEWQHRDRKRLVWPAWAWIIPWIVGMIIHPSMFQILFIASSVAYSLKKQFPWISLISWIINGSIKVWMVAMIPSPTWGLYLVGGLMSLRNLAGDIRDGGKDSAEKVFTLPVALGLRENIPFIYPSCLILTSVTWVFIGKISPLWLVPVFIVQKLTYNLTPR